MSPINPLPIIERIPACVNIVTTVKKSIDSIRSNGLGSSRLNLVSKKRSFGGAGLATSGAYSTPKRSLTTAVTPSSARLGVERDLWVTESMDSATFKLMCENERSRYLSLRNNMNSFESTRVSVGGSDNVCVPQRENVVVIERCARLHLFSVRITGVQSAADKTDSRHLVVFFTEADSNVIRSAQVDKLFISRVTSLLGVSSTGEVDQLLIKTASFDVVLSQTHTPDEHFQVQYTIVRMTRCINT
jgi:hypothetical protein